MTTVVLADDHEFVRKGVRAVVAMEPDLSIVGEAADGLEAVRLTRDLQPDVLVVDLMMPGLGGIEVTRQVKKAVPKTNVVVLSMHSNEAYVVESLRQGAAAYVLKDGKAEELTYAVREAAAGRHYLSSPLSERAIATYMRAADVATDDLYELLTPREREVLHLAASGCTNATIAAKLSISPRTAEMHRQHLHQKLGLHNQTELVLYAIRKGIISEQPSSS